MTIKMTRKEASDKLLATEARHLQFDHVSVAYLLDCLEILGLIKFEEPPKVEQRITMAFAGRTINGHKDLLNILDQNGLEIVGKKR